MILTDKYVSIEYMGRNYPDSMKPDISDLLHKEWSFSYEDNHTKSDILDTLVIYIKEWLALANADVLDNLNERLIDLDEMVQFFKENIYFYDTLINKCVEHGYVGDVK